MSDTFPERIRVGDLMAYRDETWVGTVAAHKAEELRVLAVGRDEECVDMVAAYCRFLKGLEDGTENSVLRDWLREADGKLETLTRRARSRD